MRFCYSQLVTALIFRVTGMALDPDEADIVQLQQIEQLFPKVGIERRLLGISLPAVGAPFFCPALLHGVDDVFGVGIEGDITGLFESGQTGDDGSQLHAVVGGGRFAAGQLLADPFVAQDDTIAAGARVARAGAVGENFYLFSF